MLYLSWIRVFRHDPGHSIPMLSISQVQWPLGYPGAQSGLITLDIVPLYGWLTSLAFTDWRYQLGLSPKTRDNFDTCFAAKDDKSYSWTRWMSKIFTYYIRVTIEIRLVFNSKVFIQLNYKGIVTVYKWQIGNA